MQLHLWHLPLIVPQYRSLLPSSIVPTCRRLNWCLFSRVRLRAAFRPILFVHVLESPKAENGACRSLTLVGTQELAQDAEKLLLVGPGCQLVMVGICTTECRVRRLEFTLVHHDNDIHSFRKLLEGLIAVLLDLVFELVLGEGDAHDLSQEVLFLLLVSTGLLGWIVVHLITDNATQGGTKSLQNSTTFVGAKCA